MRSLQAGAEELLPLTHIYLATRPTLSASTHRDTAAVYSGPDGSAGSWYYAPSCTYKAVPFFAFAIAGGGVCGELGLGLVLRSELYLAN
eukprot:scaffold11724_cov124-Isochrysis_galbana.AAC.3